MKRIIFLLTILLASMGTFAQTATNFTCNDCTGASHTLFDELNAGKVVVLCWVMPCASCIGPSKTTYNVVQSFELSHPDRVKMYVCDDYANTTCSSLNSWCIQNGLTKTTKFSNTAINMNDYGSTGMPKIVVVGNYTHQVYYNANNSVNATLLSNAISAALEDFTVDLNSPTPANEINVFPNPVNDRLSVSFTSANAGQCRVTLYNNSAVQVSTPKTFDLQQGNNILSLDTKELKNGIYFALLQTEAGTMKTKFVVSH